VPLFAQAGLWGLLSGSALIIGAAFGYFIRIDQRLVAAVMAFGSGVLISALSFDLMDEAYREGGFDSTASGFLLGAVVFTAANIAVSRRGGAHRKRSGSDKDEKQQHASEGGGLGIAVGALLDGIPESVVIGVSLLQGIGVSLTAVVAVFLSNLPEGLSSAAGMKAAGRSRDQETVETVRRIFRLRKHGTTLQGIADALNGDGTPTARGGKWWLATVRYVLDNRHG
jgi:ZIP family zinc transporter